MRPVPDLSVGVFVDFVRLHAGLSPEVNNIMRKQYTKQQIAEAIKYWQNRLDALDRGRQVKESSSKRAYLDSVLPQNGITLYDDAGKKLNFGFKLNSGMAMGWTGVDK